jgi:hypothetical protein
MRCLGLGIGTAKQFAVCCCDVQVRAHQALLTRSRPRPVGKVEGKPAQTPNPERANLQFYRADDVQVRKPSFPFQTAAITSSAAIVGSEVPQQIAPSQASGQASWPRSPATLHTPPPAAFRARRIPRTPGPLASPARPLLGPNFGQGPWPAHDLGSIWAQFWWALLAPKFGPTFGTGHPA